MNKNIRLFMLVATMSSLAACSTMAEMKQKRQAREIAKLDYQSANKKVVNLEVPPDLRDPRNGDLYQLPTGMVANPNAMQVKSNPTHRVLNPVKDVRLERSGSQQWLHIGNEKAAAELWPLLRAFWQEIGFTIQSEEPQAGLMETEWAENRAKLPNQGLRKLFDKVGIGGIYSTSERDKFMIRMENDSSGGHNIFFSHKGMEEVYDGKNKDRTVWQPRANDPNLEAAMLARFMQYLGADQQVLDQQIAKQTDQQTGTQYAKRESNTVVVYGQAERNVNRIASALDRIGLTVESFEGQRGMFVVRPAAKEVVTKPKKTASKLAKFFGRSKDAEIEEPEKAPQLFVALEQVDNGQRIHLIDQLGKPYVGNDANKYLDALYKELR